MRLALLPVLAAGLALPAAALPAEAAQAASACRASGPRALRAQPAADGTAVTLRWRGGSSPRLAFRVLRDGQVVGQTHGHALRVAVAPGRHRFAVRAVLGSDVTRCQAALRRTVKPRLGAAPGPTAGLSATPVG